MRAVAGKRQGSADKSKRGKTSLGKVARDSSIATASVLATFSGKVGVTVVACRCRELVPTFVQYCELALPGSLAMPLTTFADKINYLACRNRRYQQQ